MPAGWLTRCGLLQYNIPGPEGSKTQGTCRNTSQQNTYMWWSTEFRPSQNNWYIISDSWIKGRGCLQVVKKNCIQASTGRSFVDIQIYTYDATMQKHNLLCILCTGYINSVRIIRNAMDIRQVMIIRQEVLFWFKSSILTQSTIGYINSASMTAEVWEWLQLY